MAQQAFAAEPAVTTILISPISSSVQIGNTVQFNASTTDQFNNPIPVPIAWQSSNPSVGAINEAGLFIAISEGTTDITALSGQVSATVRVLVGMSFPRLPQLLAGSVTIDALPAPVGTIIIAKTVDGIQRGSIAVSQSGQYSSPPFEYLMVSGQDISLDAPISFFANNLTAHQTVPYSPGGINNNFNLSFGIVPPAPIVVEVSNATTTVNATTTIPVQIKDIIIPAGIGSYDFVLNYDPLGLRVADVLEGDSPFGAPASFTIDNVAGRVLINDLVLEVPGALGNKVAANIVFEALAMGNWEIRLTINSLKDTDNNNVSAVADNGVLNVVGRTLTSINLIPNTVSLWIVPELSIGAAQLFIAQTLDQLGDPIAAQLVWTSSDNNVGTVNQTGLFTAVGAGGATVRAQSGQIFGTANVVVTRRAPPPVCETGADENLDGRIDNLEVLGHVRHWKEGRVSNSEILKAIRFWKAGTGC